MENDPAETEEDDEVIFLSSDQESQDEEDTTMDSTRNIPEKESQDKDQTTAPQSQQPPVKIKRKRNATTRKSISLNMKLEILDRLKNGEGPTKIARSYGWNESTIRTIKKNESIIRQSVSAGSLLTSRYSSYTRDSIMEAMEQRLLEWIDAHNKRIDEIDINNNITGNQPNSKEQCNSPVRPLDSAAVRLKAVNIYNELKNERKQAIKQIRNRNGPKYGTKSKTMIHQELDSATDSWNFAASKGWFGNFRRRYSLNSKMRHDPAYAAAAAIVDASESARMGNANRFVGAAGSLTCSVVVPGHDQSSALSSSSRNYLHLNHHHQQQHSSRHYRQLSSNNNNLNPDIEDEFSIKVAKIIQQNACKQLQLQRTGNSFDANESRPKTNLILIGDNNNNCITIEDQNSKLCKIVQDEGSSSESSSSGDILGDSTGSQPVGKPKQEDNQFTAENIGSVLQLGITLKKFIIQIDPDRDRANKFCKNLQNCLEPYQEAYGRLAVVNEEDKGDAVLRSKPRTTTSIEFRDNGLMRLQQPNEQEDDGDGDQSSSASLSGLLQSNEPSANNMTSFSDTSFTAANVGTTTTPTFTNPVTVRLKSSKSSDSSSSSSSSSNEPEYILSDRGVAIQVGSRVLRHSARPCSFLQSKKHPLNDEKFRDMLSSAKAKSALRNRRLKLEIARLIKEDRNILQTEIVKALPDDLKASKSTVHRIIKELDVRRTKKYFVGRNLPR